MKSAKFFSICANEVADSSNQEQLPLILRFVDSNSIREEFVDFILCNTGTTGVAIAEKLLAINLNIFVDRPMTGQVTWPVNVEELQQVSCQISLKQYMFTVLLIALTFVL